MEKMNCLNASNHKSLILFNPMASCLLVWCIGTLLRSNLLEINSSIDTGADSHPHNLIRFISFGFQNTLSDTQMIELAKGFEECKKPFI
uniref:Uncharacterized protein n=1 Tax=Lactuca sativa TaxID=4236 RepID=A0A9R1WTY0_LACSA|nr:hypothetical protein LSAT_V11C900465960 [Lactuca sativa]